MKKWSVALLLAAVMLFAFAFVACGGDKTTVPGKPTKVTATAGIGQITLSWEAPDDDGGQEITNYYVAFSDAANPDVVALAWKKAAKTGEHTFSGLVNGRLHTLYVKAENSKGFSLFESTTATPFAHCNEHICEICGRTCDLHICEICERTCDLHVCEICEVTCDNIHCDICEGEACDEHICDICERTCDNIHCDICDGEECDNIHCDICEGEECEEENCEICYAKTLKGSFEATIAILSGTTDDDFEIFRDYRRYLQKHGGSGLYTFVYFYSDVLSVSAGEKGSFVDWNMTCVTVFFGSEESVDVLKHFTYPGNAEYGYEPVDEKENSTISLEEFYGIIRNNNADRTDRLSDYLRIIDLFVLEETVEGADVYTVDFSLFEGDYLDEVWNSYLADIFEDMFGINLSQEGLYDIIMEEFSKPEYEEYAPMLAMFDENMTDAEVVAKLLEITESFMSGEELTAERKKWIIMGSVAGTGEDATRITIKDGRVISYTFLEQNGDDYNLTTIELSYDNSIKFVDWPDVL